MFSVVRAKGVGAKLSECPTAEVVMVAGAEDMEDMEEGVVVVVVAVGVACKEVDAGRLKLG